MVYMCACMCVQVSASVCVCVLFAHCAKLSVSGCQLISHPETALHTKVLRVYARRREATPCKMTACHATGMLHGVSLTMVSERVFVQWKSLWTSWRSRPPQSESGALLPEEVD